jgi:hypothetical protein
LGDVPVLGPAGREGVVGGVGEVEVGVPGGGVENYVEIFEAVGEVKAEEFDAHFEIVEGDVEGLGVVLFEDVAGPCNIRAVDGGESHLEEEYGDYDYDAQ